MRQKYLNTDYNDKGWSKCNVTLCTALPTSDVLYTIIHQTFSYQNSNLNKQFDEISLITYQDIDVFSMI